MNIQTSRPTSRAAKHGIIVKGGGPLETLARAKVLLLDKTGTVTSARPQVVAVETFGRMSSDDVVRHAASIEQVSLHPFAPAILAEARSRRVELSFPLDVREQMGTGIAGTVDGRRTAVGQIAFAAPGTPRTPELRSIEMRTAVGAEEEIRRVFQDVYSVMIVEEPWLFQDYSVNDDGEVVTEYRKV